MTFDSAAADIPPIPTRHHRRQRPPSGIGLGSFHPSNHHHQAHNHASSSAHRHGSKPSVSPASPEVISNLISSLSVISQPASSHFESNVAPARSPSIPGASRGSLSVPTSPGRSGAGVGAGAGAGAGKGSFGVDYGAFSHPTTTLDDLRQDPVSLDDIAASPPVIRTSKPPSGYSPLTSPKSPRSPDNTHNERGSSLKSFIRRNSSSSAGSLGSGSKNDDSHSIGNLSIERGSAPTPELTSQRSQDSWGKRASRSTKGLMYMSSRERLRERDLEKKRSSLGAMGPSASGTAGGNPAGSSHSTGKPDPFLAELAISEEPVMNTDHLGADLNGESPRPIPKRDSSLRRRSSKSKRSSARRSKRDTDAPLSDAIPEADEPVRQRDSYKKRHARAESDHGTPRQHSLHGSSLLSSPTKATASTSRRVDETSRLDGIASGDRTDKVDEVDDEGAPFPAVSQGRRREDHIERASRRLSGRQSPGPSDGLRLKRSSSKLKRLSAPLGTRSEENLRSPSPAPPERPQNPPTGYERPLSADSVDDAVESYLCSPRLSQKIKHPQTGRVISFSEVGDSEGSAVFCCVGMGLTRYITAFYDELALTLKLRLITPDRPGVGDSEAYSDGTATPLSWPDDVYAICQALKITKFSILAHSAGAIYALATALRMPQHIRSRIHLLAPWIPPSQMNVFGGSQALPPTNAIPTSQRILRALPTPILKAANSSFMTATSSSITSSLPKNPRRTKRKANANAARDSAATRNNAAAPSMDKENMGQEYDKSAAQGTTHGDGDMEAHSMSENLDRMPPPASWSKANSADRAMMAAAADAMDKERQMTYDVRLTHAIWDLATTGANPAVDLLVCLERRHTIGFRYVDITRPVVIHHGSRDTRVPVDNVKWLGKTMRRCEVRVLEGEGHGLMASAGVMGSVLMEISKEWEDWMRVTGADGRKDKERGRRSGR